MCNDDENGWIALEAATRNVVMFLRMKGAPAEPGAGVGTAGAFTSGEDTDPDGMIVPVSERNNRVACLQPDGEFVMDR